MNNKTIFSNRNYLHISFFLSIISFFGFYSCNNTKEQQPVNKQSTVKIILSADTTINKVGLVKFGGISMDDLHPHQDTLELIFDEPLNDFYQLLSQKEGGFTLDQLWLQGDDITIKAHFSKNDQYITVDTVLNSPFYYYTKEINDEYYQLIEDSASINITNSFLIDKIKENIDNNFSHSLVGDFMFDNSGNKQNLKILQTLIQDQDSTLKKHFLSKHDKLNKILNIESIILSDFEFYNEAEKITDIPLHKDSLYLLDFWFVHCPPCLEDHLIIKKEINHLSNSGIKVIGISNDRNHTPWLSLLEKKNYSWQNYREKSDKSISKKMGIYTFPMYYLINSEGEILQQNARFEECLNELKEKGLVN